MENASEGQGVVEIITLVVVAMIAMKAGAWGRKKKKKAKQPYRGSGIIIGPIDTKPPWTAWRIFWGYLGAILTVPIAGYLSMFPIVWSVNSESMAGWFLAGMLQVCALGGVWFLWVPKGYMDHKNANNSKNIGDVVISFQFLIFLAWNLSVSWSFVNDV